MRPLEPYVLGSKLCTFHSHPASHKGADVPSMQDVFHFLNFRESSHGHGGAKSNLGLGQDQGDHGHGQDDGPLD